MKNTSQNCSPKRLKEKYLSIPITLQGLPSLEGLYMLPECPNGFLQASYLNNEWKPWAESEIYSEAKVQCGPVTLHAAGDPTTAELRKGSRGCLCK